MIYSQKLKTKAQDYLGIDITSLSPVILRHKIERNLDARKLSMDLGIKMKNPQIGALSKDLEIAQELYNIFMDEYIEILDTNN